MHREYDKISIGKEQVVMETEGSHAKQLIRPVIFCMIILVIVFLIDYYVDSYASVRITYQKIAQISQEHNYVIGNQIPLSERKPKWDRINIMERKEFLVIGSSRSAMFTSENMEEESFYNLSVSGGSTIDDYLAEIHILFSQDKLPDKLLMEISPATFNANIELIRWQEWGDNTLYMKQILEGKIPSGRQPDLGIQWKNLFSPSYFQYNFENLMEHKRAWIESSEDYDNPSYLTVHSDGSSMYGRDYQNKYTEDQIMEETKNICNSRTIYCCDDYREIDKELQNTFEEIIEFLMKNGVEVSLYLPPYSEEMYQFISHDDTYKVILEVEAYLISYASENGIRILGSYDPTRSALKTKDFYDAYHVREEKIIDTLWERQVN